MPKKGGSFLKLTKKCLIAGAVVAGLLLAPTVAMASVNIGAPQTSGSEVQITQGMIHPVQGSNVVTVTVPAPTTTTTQGSSVVTVKAPTTTQGGNEVSLKGIVQSHPVAVSTTNTNPDATGVVNASTTVAPIMPQVPAATSLTTSEQQMVDEINQARADAGVAPVQVDLRLVTAARIKAEDLYLNNYFSHVSPNFGYTASLLPGLGLNVNYWSENVAGNLSVDAAEAALMESIGHRVNILDPNVNYVGVACLEGISPYNLYVQEFAHE